MEYKITLQPSGHEFVAHENESILEAGLRAGYNLRYQCDNGSCGECQSRLLEGRVSPVMHSDYRVSEAEKGLGGFLLCASQAMSDLVIDAAEYDHASDMPYQEITARVRRIDRLQQGIIVLQLRTPRTNTLRFLAGQCVSLEIAGVGARTLPIASCPCNGMLLEFHIRHREHDEFSRYVSSQLVVNDEVFVKGPSGDFVLDESSTRPLLLVAYDTGFASVKSLIEHAIALDISQDMFLYRIACGPQGVYMHNICRSWGDAIDNFHYHAFRDCVPLDCSDREVATVCDRLLSVLDAGGELLPAGCDVYLSGPGEMLINLGGVLQERGLPAQHLHTQSIS